jgi:hypothetical protein
MGKTEEKKKRKKKVLSTVSNMNLELHTSAGLSTAPQNNL